MRRDSKLSSILHVLLHMAHAGRPMTSDELSSYLDTNPVLVRRVMAGLRERGYVASVKGHGGGWRIVCDLHRVTLHDIYVAVGSPTIFAMGNRVEQPGCLVEQVVNQSLAGAFDEAQALLMQRFGAVTLADLAERFSQQYAAHQGAMHEQS
ncbi:transcriptional regulator [Janthinobacterium sp. FT14W]|uniref:RrF2 family transcriptional regulator n=1 Tax=Janthinobacterium sp. FT14W TaxID=2654253 RepID=UPI0012641CA9|nr:Rrf2 family transcriptional regulator [Janthinobacterium sp. FT14W]KAB8060215.1 transcriptional regulator [Janthinobacterium sp. FT14W]